LRKSANLFRPWLNLSVPDPWLGEVIENKRLLGKLPHEFDRSGKLPRKNQQVVRQLKGAQAAEPAQDIGTQEERIIGFVLDDVAYADKPGMSREPFECDINVRVAEVDPADDTADARIGIGEAKEPVGFADGLAGLHDDGAAEAVGLLERGEVRWKPVALKRGVWRDPWILGGVIAPEVLVGIEFHGCG
jgi:hypothetical protein